MDACDNSGKRLTTHRELLDKVQQFSVNRRSVDLFGVEGGQATIFRKVWGYVSRYRQNNDSRHLPLGMV